MVNKYPIMSLRIACEGINPIMLSHLNQQGFHTHTCTHTHNRGNVFKNIFTKLTLDENKQMIHLEIFSVVHIPLSYLAIIKWKAAGYCWPGLRIIGSVFGL